MKEPESLQEFAFKELGSAVLKDARRTRRVVKMLTAIAATPAGRMTEVFKTPAELEAAGRFIRSEDVAFEELRLSMSNAAARRSRGNPYVYIPLDQSALTVADPQGRKDVGSVGTTRIRARGLQAMTALAVTPDGVPQGILWQQFWAREHGKKKSNWERSRLGPEKKETQYWLNAIEGAQAALSREAPGVRPWFQIDRGADAWPVLLQATEGIWLTVRAAWDRRVIDEEQALQAYLWQTVEKQEPLGDYLLAVEGGPKRKPRLARLVLRACSVVLQLKDRSSSRREFSVTLNAVLARESGTTPRGEQPIEWLLLTNHPVHNITDAYAVVYGYSIRWRIEEFHRAWKSGGYCVEDSQLHSRESLERWALLLSSAAVRLMRLSYLARNHGHQPATVELTQPEIDALILARSPKSYEPGDVPRIDEAVLWLAHEGGYTGKSSGGPPGATVLARGLARIAVLARVLTDGKLRGRKK
jgi:hypothetical protein